jgi:acyl carrier protein
MLNDDLDLEADLGIDSIKRTEILGVALREMGVSLNERMEEATTARTIRRILAALSTATAPQPPVQPSAPALEATGS